MYLLDTCMSFLTKCSFLLPIKCFNYLFLALGVTPGLLNSYSYFFAEKSFLMGLGDHIQCQELNLGLRKAGALPTLLYLWSLISYFFDRITCSSDAGSAQDCNDHQDYTHKCFERGLRYQELNSGSYIYQVCMCSTTWAIYQLPPFLALKLNKAKYFERFPKRCSGKCKGLSQLILNNLLIMFLSIIHVIMMEFGNF